MKDMISETVITVPFYDLDPMNIVWHGNYVKYIEQARCDFFKMINYTYEDMYKDGLMYPIAKMDFKFIKSAEFYQQLKVRCILKEVEPAIIFRYEILDLKTEEKFCVANTMQIGVNIKTKETLITISDKFRKRLEEVKND